MHEPRSVAESSLVQLRQDLGRAAAQAESALLRSEDAQAKIASMRGEIRALRIALVLTAVVAATGAVVALFVCNSIH